MLHPVPTSPATCAGGRTAGQARMRRRTARLSPVERRTSCYSSTRRAASQHGHSADPAEGPDPSGLAGHPRRPQARHTVCGVLRRLDHAAGSREQWRRFPRDGHRVPSRTLRNLPSQVRRHLRGSPLPKSRELGVRQSYRLLRLRSENQPAAYDAIQRISPAHTHWRIGELKERRHKIYPEGIVLLAFGYVEGRLPDGPVPFE